MCSSSEQPPDMDLTTCVKSKRGDPHKDETCVRRYRSLSVSQSSKQDECEALIYQRRTVDMGQWVTVPPTRLSGSCTESLLSW